MCCRRPVDCPGQDGELLAHRVPRSRDSVSRPAAHRRLWLRLAKPRRSLGRSLTEIPDGFSTSSRSASTAWRWRKSARSLRTRSPSSWERGDLLALAARMKLQGQRVPRALAADSGAGRQDHR